MNQREIERAVQDAVVAHRSMCSLVRVEAVTDRDFIKWKVFLNCSTCGPVSPFWLYDAGLGIGVHATIKEEVEKHEAAH